MRTLSDRAIVLAKQQGYTANKQGDVFTPKGKKVKGSVMGRGKNPTLHKRMTVYVSGLNDRGHASVLMHRFIAYYFYGEEVFNHQVVRHLNDIASDNRIENLALGSQKDNRSDIPREKISIPAKKYAHLLVERSRKLTDEDVIKMRGIREETKEPYRSIASIFNISTMTCYRAINKHSWKGIG